MRRRTMGRRGFTLIEVMMATVVLTVGSVGAMMGMIAAAADLRAGQTRLHKQVLVDATLQRARLHNKEQLYGSAIAVGAASDMPPLQSVGGGNWTIDPSASASGDLSAGALFVMLPDGTFAPCTATTSPACTAAPTSCIDDAIPLDVFCREVVVTRTGATFSPGNVLAAGTFVMTQWARVVQRQRLASDTVAGAVLGREVFAQ